MKPAAPAELLAPPADFEVLTPWERAAPGRALRRLAWTHGEIRRVIPVAKGTFAGWCREIRLSTEQVARMRTSVDALYRPLAWIDSTPIWS